ncbi:NAC domain-containing protein 86-like [Euphorbia lathyris]|uniref:NAC domain-containing protein 86-like n=1 Tax=Euphorbia lathyris TaxID=212925 RepID=UPI0033142B97
MENGTGYRFHPTDEELVNYYLKLKMLGRNDQVCTIPEINLLKLEPWEISGKAMAMSNDPNDQVWYFFCAPNYKYLNSQREDRKTKAGFWKVTGKDRKILKTGVKKTLVFHQGHASNAVRTSWVIHQYNATFDFPIKKNFAICKLKKKIDSEDMPALNLEYGQSSANYADNQNSYYASNYGGFNNQLPSTSTNNPREDHSDEMQAYMQSFDEYKEMDYNLNSALQWSNANHYYG